MRKTVRTMVVMEQADAVGVVHAEQAAELAEAFEAVLDVASPEFAPLLKTERQRLSDWRARIAVVGQVKAGKSTFLSALVGQPQFLPSEINPWTSVITNLHFGHSSDPKAGGVFHFFGEDDWDRIIEGDKQTRELAEELLPGFTSEVLERQVKEMRERARKRLGRFYNVLLGRKHEYDFISRDILERYVCAGTEEETPVEEITAKVGRYSDITERADIYFPPGRFAIPMVFTDTPGVNDPFLVRDEFTCRTLLQSDIFVVTLSAHQALTEVDLGLIRMLAAHKGKRIIIFINRIDELDNFAKTGAQIQASVSERMLEAVPDRNFDVIIGSAYWAESAAGDSADVNARVSEIDGLDAFLKDHYGSSETDPVKKLRLASGLTAVEKAIETSITDGVGKTLLDEVAHALGSITSTVCAMHRTQADELRASQDAGADKEELAEALRASLSSRSEAARDITDELNEVFSEAENVLGGIVATSWEAFQRELNLIGQNFIDQQTEALSSVVRANFEDTKIEIDAIDLRNQLGDQITKSYASARDKLDFVLSRTSAHASRLIRPLLGASQLSLSAENLPYTEVAPIFLTSTQNITLELTTERGWKFWMNSKMSSDEATVALKRVILAEFNPSIENLAVIAHEALVERSAEAMRRMTSLANVTVEAISEHVEQYDQDQAKLTEASSDVAIGELRAKLSDEIGAMDQKIELLDGVISKYGQESVDEELRSTG